MSDVAKLGAGNALTSPVRVAGATALVGGALGGVGISGPLLVFREWGAGFYSPSGLVNDFNLMASLGIVLTMASLVGLYALVAGSRLGGRAPSVPGSLARRCCSVVHP